MGGWVVYSDFIYTPKNMEIASIYGMFLKLRIFSRTFQERRLSESRRWFENIAIEPISRQRNSSTSSSPVSPALPRSDKKICRAIQPGSFDSYTLNRERIRNLLRVAYGDALIARDEKGSVVHSSFELFCDDSIPARFMDDADSAKSSQTSRESADSGPLPHS